MNKINMIKGNYILTFILLFFLKVFIAYKFFEPSKLNPDEELNYSIAERYQAGLGYTMMVNGKPEATAFHGSGTIFLYKFLINYHISKLSFTWIYFFTSNIFFFFSLIWFYKLACHFIDKRMAFYTAVIYGLFPSIIYFVGALFTYESICTYFLIYFILVIITLFNTGNIKQSNYYVLPLIICISCLFRPQLLMFYFISLLILPFLFIKKRQLISVVSISALSLTLTGLAHIPILIKNNKIFNEYILSTQFGFELLQGHNPTARGSWQGEFKKKENVLYVYAHKHIKGLDAMNEYQESLARKRLAVQWIKSSPGAEIKLTLRKLAIYFLPRNYEVLPGYNILNPYNLIIYILFLFSVSHIAFSSKRQSFIDLFILFLPIGFSIAISIIFFVGYRWRYFAEPFMIIFAGIFLKKLIGRINLYRAKYSTYAN